MYLRLSGLKINSGPRAKEDVFAGHRKYPTDIAICEFAGALGPRGLEVAAGVKLEESEKDMSSVTVIERRIRTESSATSPERPLADRRTV